VIDPLDPEQFEPDPAEEQDLGPDAPEPSIPSVDTDASAADPALRAMFWKLVLLYKVAILGVTIGVLLVAFDTRAGAGIRLLAGAVLLLGYTLYRTYRNKQRLDAGEFHDTDGGPAEDTVTDGATDSTATDDGSADGTTAADGATDSTATGDRQHDATEGKP
jgi:hypothetical protein